MSLGPAREQRDKVSLRIHSHFPGLHFRGSDSSSALLQGSPGPFALEAVWAPLLCAVRVSRPGHFCPRKEAVDFLMTVRQTDWTDGSAV